jgi:hypothetical protein
MALTKGSETVLDAWALTANAAIRKGAFLDVSSAYEATLFIKAALGEAVASTGQPEVIVQVCFQNSDPGSVDEWNNYARFVGPVGTPVILSLNATEPIGETSIAVTDPVTANVDNDGKFKFIKHSTAANSEVVFQTANSGDAGDTITILDGLKNEQTSSSTLLDIDDARTEVVAQWTIGINCRSLKGVRVIYNADYDTDGPDVYTWSAYIINSGL